MAPMSAPRVIVAVMIDDPAGKAFYGGTVAGPVFSGVTASTLQLLGVPPDVATGPESAKGTSGTSGTKVGSGRG